MIGAIFGVLIVSALIHISISWIGKRIPQAAHFVENFSGTILISCILSWAHQMETSDRIRPSMVLAYAALYFFFVFASKISGETLYKDVPPRKTKISLRAEFCLFLTSLIAIRIMNAVTGNFLSTESSLPIYLLSIIVAYYLLEATFIKYRKTLSAETTKPE